MKIIPVVRFFRCLALSGLFLAIALGPLALHNAEAQDYWTDGGAFDPAVTAEHYGNAASYIKGFSAT